MSAPGTTDARAGSPRLAPAPAGAPDDVSRRSWWLIVVVVVAAALRVAPWLWPHTFLGPMEYDDGVYYGAARALLHGLVPYRDVTIVHPPLASLLLLPAAAIGAAAGDPAGMAAARIEVVLADCLNVWLVYRLTRDAACGAAAYRRLAPLVAAGVYAVAPGAVAASHTVMLEPLSTAFALTAMACLLRRPGSRGGAVAAGAGLAAAMAVKLFAVAYVVVAAGWLLARGRRRILPVATGLVVTTAVVVGPFVALAGPHRMWRDVVASQLTRPADGDTTVPGRLADLVGVTGAPVAGLLLLVAVAVTLTAAFSLGRRNGSEPAPAASLWVVTAVLTGVAFAQSPSYFLHYAGFFAAPFAVTVGLAVTAGSAGPPRARLAIGAVVTALVMVGAATTVAADVAWQGEPSMRAVTAAVPQGACVYSDAVSLLVAADRFRLPDAGCPGWLDGRGQNLVWSAGSGGRDFYPSGFRRDRRWQDATARQLRAAAYLLVRSDPTRMPEWSAELRAYVAAHFHRIWAGTGRMPAQLWARD